MLILSHWVAASGIQGNPPRNQVRVHSMITQAPASPSIATKRTGVRLPTILGMVHQAARYQTPVQTPTMGPSRNIPTQVTGCSQERLIVQATAWAARSVQAKTL